MKAKLLLLSSAIPLELGIKDELAFTTQEFI
jgi:hypothetical protein